MPFSHEDTFLSPLEGQVGACWLVCWLAGLCCIGGKRVMVVVRQTLITNPHKHLHKCSPSTTSAHQL